MSVDTRAAVEPNRYDDSLASPTLILAVALLNLEGVVVEATGLQLPTHRVFTLLFVPSAFLIAGISAWAIGRGLSNNALAVSLLWRVGLVAAFAFLVVNLAMEASGWVVGAPGAAARYTMLTVMFAGNLGAALAGGAVLGWLLATAARKSGRPQHMKWSNPMKTIRETNHEYQYFDRTRSLGISANGRRSNGRRHPAAGD